MVIITRVLRVWHPQLPSSPQTAFKTVQLSSLLEIFNPLPLISSGTFETRPPLPSARCRHLSTGENIRGHRRVSGRRMYWGQDAEETGRKKSMEERVWESTWEEEKIDMLGKPTSRDAYFSCLIYCVLTVYADAQKALTLQALFCVSELGNQCPPRHAYSSFELLHILVRCRCQPSKIMLSCASIIELGLWDRREEAFDLLSRLCSRVSHLVIGEYEPGYDDDSGPKQLSQMFRYLLEVVFCDSKRRPTVTRYHYKVWPRCNEFSLEALHHMADIMSPKSSCGRDPYTQYNGLRVLAVMIESHSADLRMIIEHQTALQTLYILVFFSNCRKPRTRPIDGLSWPPLLASNLLQDDAQILFLPAQQWRPHTRISNNYG